MDKIKVLFYICLRIYQIYILAFLNSKFYLKLLQKTNYYSKCHLWFFLNFIRFISKQQKNEKRWVTNSLVAYSHSLLKFFNFFLKLLLFKILVFYEAERNFIKTIKIYQSVKRNFKNLKSKVHVLYIICTVWILK